MYYFNILKGSILWIANTYLDYYTRCNLYQVLKKRPWGPNYVRIMNQQKVLKNYVRIMNQQKLILCT